MSDSDREDVKQEAAEAVRRHLELSDKTRIKSSIGTTLSVCVTIIVATWTAAWVISNYLHDIRDGQSRIESTLNYKVSVGQFRGWVYSLDHANRTIDPAKGLSVPDVPAADSTVPSH